MNVPWPRFAAGVRIADHVGMELLVVVHHPVASIRRAEEIALDLARIYDRVMGAASTHHYRAMEHATVILLVWPAIRLRWSSWHEDEGGALATAGLPLLLSSTDGESAMLTPGRLAAMMGGEGREKLGYCGGYFAAAHIAAAPGGPRGVGDGPKTVRLMTNHLGDVPLYRASSDGVTVWSNKAAAAAMLAGLPPRLDEQAAAEFLMLSHCLEDRTLWAGVSTEPAATLITLEPGAAAPWWEPYLALPAAYFAHRQTKQEAAGRVVAQMGPLAQALGEGGCEARLHLSGGQDSRAVAAILRHHGLRLTCLTHNTPNEEVPSARRLARRLGMPYRTVAVGFPAPEAFAQAVEPSLWQSDGLMSLKYLGVRYDLAFIREEGYLPIEGYGGEHGRAYYFGDEQGLALLRRGDYSRLYQKTLGHRGDLLQRTAAAAAIRDVIAAFIERNERAGLAPEQVSSFFYVNQRARRWAAGRRNTGWQWMVDPLQLPCWTYPAMSADAEDQIDDGLIKAVIDAAWPEANRVPTVRDLAYQGRRRRVASNRIVRGAYKLFDRVKGPRPPSPHDRALRRLRDQLLEKIQEAEPVLGSIVTADEVRHWLAREPWDYDRTELTWHAATLAHWCGQFINKAMPVRPARRDAAAATPGNTVA